MQLFLMRHGESVPSSAWGGSDASRPLSPVGLAKLEAAIKEMKRTGFSVSGILASPFERTIQTANLLSKGLDLNPPIVCQELAAGAHYDQIRRVVRDHAEKASLLVVGHMPEIAIFGSRVTGDPMVIDRGLEPAEILAIEITTLDKWEGGRLLWWRKSADWKKANA
jgi:phosphohistidine phosphatase SixA